MDCGAGALDGKFPVDLMLLRNVWELQGELRNRGLGIAVSIWRILSA